MMFKRPVFFDVLYALSRTAVNAWEILVLHKPFTDFVYVNQDGSARELSEDERKYLRGEFLPTDGARPYIKETYRERDGWGSLSGFILRRRLPPSISVKPVNPNYATLPDDPVDYAGISDGYEQLRAKLLEHQRQREKLASVDSETT